MNPKTLRAYAIGRELQDGVLLAHADAWEAQVDQMNESYHRLSVAYNATCKRLEEAEKVMPYAKIVARIVRPGTHRLAKIIDDETTDEEKDVLLAFCAALAKEEK